VAKPLRWHVENIKRFMLFVGPVSSLFDYATFALMWFFFGCREFLSPQLDEASRQGLVSLFQTGWFVESLLTQTLIVLIIRTKKVPFFQSRPSSSMLLATLSVMVLAVWLPYSPFSQTLGLVPLPVSYWLWVAVFLLAYGVLAHLVKRWFFAKFGGE
ncbi:MAG: cation transporting ATPase C-terminal domain-containing protein, partial [Thermoanaerobaculum sp.]